MEQRVILHVDCDCFYASVEMRDRPELGSVPLAIGGSPDQRGVVATCNYIARQFGVRSAMPMSSALRLCPQLVVLPPDMPRYRSASDEVMRILQNQSDKFERVSIDEAYLELHVGASGLMAAEAIKNEVSHAVGIPVSVGIAPNRFLAKVASDWNKPDGIYEVRPDNAEIFAAELPVNRIPGVGPRLEERLNARGITLAGDLLSWSLPQLVHDFGKMGAALHKRCRGLDDRAIGESRKRKSASVEKTFSADLQTLESCMVELPGLWSSLERRLEGLKNESSRISPFIKVKFSDFSQTTLSDCHQPLSLQAFELLLKLALMKQNKPVRLIGLGGKLSDISAQQGQLFE